VLVLWPLNVPTQSVERDVFERGASLLSTSGLILRGDGQFDDVPQLLGHRVLLVPFPALTFRILRVRHQPDWEVVFERKLPESLELLGVGFSFSYTEVTQWAAWMPRI
jgi:hypothetical protein